MSEFYVTFAEKWAAEALIESAESRGEPVREVLRRIAAAPIDPSELGRRPHTVPKQDPQHA